MPNVFTVRISKVLQCVPGLRRQARSQQAGQEGRQTRTGCSVKILPSLLNGWVEFLTATSVPARWKILTSARSVHFKAFVLQTVAMLKPQAHRCFHSMQVSFSGFYSCVQTDNIWDMFTQDILTAPWYISTSFSPKYGICLKGLTEMSTGPIYVWRGCALRIIKWRHVEKIQ